MRRETREIWQSVRAGFIEGWRDETRDGWKGMVSRYYLEPFVLLWRLIKRLIAKLSNH